VSKFPPKFIHIISSNAEVNVMTLYSAQYHYMLCQSHECKSDYVMLQTGILLSVVLLDVVAQQGFFQTFLIIKAIRMSLSLPKCNKLVCSSLDSLRKGFTLIASI
jgi:hypothetical protein